MRLRCLIRQTKPAQRRKIQRLVASDQHLIRRLENNLKGILSNHSLTAVSEGYLAPSTFDELWKIIRSSESNKFQYRLWFERNANRIQSNIHKKRRSFLAEHSAQLNDNITQTTLCKYDYLLEL